MCAPLIRFPLRSRLPKQNPVGKGKNMKLKTQIKSGLGSGWLSSNHNQTNPLPSGI